MRVSTALGLLVALFAATPAAAHEVSVDELDCLPEGGNSVLAATIEPTEEGVIARAFFRQQETGDYYYKIMTRETATSFWAVLPRPTPDNPRVEYYVTVEDLAGEVLGQSHLYTAPVLAPEQCDVFFTSAQAEEAGRLAVGETVAAQEGETVLAFLCEGIVERIDVAGEVRRDEICDPLVAWWHKREFLIPAAVLGAGIVGVLIIDDRDPREVSPARP